MGILRADRVSGLGGANAINGSVVFNRNSWLNVEPHDDLAMGSGAFTIECWVNVSQLATYSTIFSMRPLNTNNVGYLDVHYNSGWSLYLNTSYVISGGGASGTSTLNTWAHLALCKSGSSTKLFIDGAQVGSTYSDSNTYLAPTDGIAIAANGYNRNGVSIVDGTYISNFRIIKGEALYTSAFTVPAQRLTKTANTVLLCCQSPGDVLKEETGKIITVKQSTTASSVPKASHFAPDVGEDYGTTFEDNAKFDTLSYLVPPGGTTAESNRGRGVFGSGETPSNDKVMDYVQIQSMGNAIKFGDLSAVSIAFAAVSSSTRGVFAIGVSPNITMEYITFTTTSNSTDFGDQAEGHIQEASCSNNTRGLFAGGLYAPNTVYNTIEYITIATTGNDTDFGDLTRAATGVAGLADTTRGIWAGGLTGSPLAVSAIMDYVTIATTGNAADFGDMTVSARDPGALASSTRGLIGSGTTPSVTNFIDYVTIQTTGNATDYGDLTSANANAGCTSNGTRGLWALGVNPAVNNSIDYTTIATLGNASDFGDLTRTVYQEDACSDSHGGIS